MHIEGGGKVTANLKREQELFIHTHQNKKKMRDTIYIYCLWGVMEASHTHAGTHAYTHKQSVLSAAK